MLSTLDGPGPIGVLGTERIGKTQRWAALFAFLGGLALSVLLTVIFWPFGLVLFLPFLFFPFRFFGARAPARACSRCGYMTRDPGTNFCPRDGAPLPPS